MKKFLVVLLFPMGVQAAPFLVADADPIVDTCTVSGLPASIPATVPEVGGTCKWDLTSLAIGNYTVTATAENVWGKSGPSAPFSFARPSSINTPAGLRLVP